jgi:hypothetical protein
MGMHLKNSWQEKLCISLCIVAIINQLVLSLRWGHDSWQMTEWLINYAGGFVRRGLPGEVILQIAEQTKIQGNYLVIFISFAIYFLVFAIIRSKSRSLFSTAFLLSPVALGSAAYQDFIVRKDALGILILLACLHFHQTIKNPFVRLLTCNILACIAILSHETFFFYALPALIIINADLQPGTVLAHCKKIAISCICYLPSIVAFGLVTHFHGTWITAKKINLSLLHLWQVMDPINSCNCLADARGSIDALAWTAAEGLNLSKSVLSSFSYGIWAPLAWAITIAFCYGATIKFLKDPSGERIDRKNINLNKQNLKSTLLFQLLMIAPLFVFGWDFGRWIFLWINSSICLFIYNHKIFPFNNKSESKYQQQIIKQKNLYSGLLIIGIPVCCWSLSRFITSTPIGYIANLLNSMALNLR